MAKANTPASKKAAKVRENELLKEEAALNESLLRDIEKQVKMYGVASDKLKEINIQKYALNALEDKIANQTSIVDILENNILKRAQKILETRKEIKELQSRSISPIVSARKLTNDEVEKVLKLKNIWKDFKIGQGLKGAGIYSKEQLKIINDVAKIAGMHSATLRANASIHKVENQQIRELIQLAIKQNAIRHQRVMSIKEEIAHEKELLSLAENNLKNRIESLGPVSKFKGIIIETLGIFKVLGLNSKYLTTLLSTSMLVAGGALLHLFTKIWGIFKNIDEEAFKARQQMGMMRKEHEVLRQQAEELYKEYVQLGVEVGNIYRTQVSIANELGSSLSATKEIVTQASLMASQFGISEQETVKTLKTLGQFGGTVSEAQTSMMGFYRALANSAGVPINEAMKDVAHASETTRTMMSKTPLDLIKASVEARRLGTTLDKMSSSSRKILDFTSSMESEMEASVLLGRPINLQLARQLAYSGKIVESNKEILRISKQIDFEHLDPYQAESFAKATGKTVEEIQSMIQASREQNKIREEANKQAAQGNYTLLNQLKNTEELVKANEAAARARGTDTNLMMKQQANQARLTSLTNSWNKVILELGYVFLPIIDNVLKISAALIPIIPLSIRVAGAFKLVSSVISDIGKFLSIITGKLGIIGKAINIIIYPLKLIGKLVGLIVAPFNIIGKIIPGLGQIIIGLQGIWSIGSRVFGIFKKLFSGDLVGALISTLKLIPGVIYDVFISPFVDVFRWIGKTFNITFGKIFGSIISGISSVGGFILDGLTWPFKKAWSWVKSLWGGNSPSVVGLSIVEGIRSIGGMIVDLLLSPFKLAWEGIKSMAGTLVGILTSPFSLAVGAIKGIWNLGSTLVSGVSNAVKGVYETITSPFRAGWDWVKEKFSSVGSTIVDGLSSVKNVVLDTVTSPFKKAWGWISSWWGGNKSADVGQPSIAKPVITQKNEQVQIPIDRVISDKEVKSYGELNDISDEIPKTMLVKTTGDQPEPKFTPQLTLESLLEEIKGLRSDLNNGKVAVNMDGQLVSTVINRGINFRGQYGALPG